MLVKPAWVFLIDRTVQNRVGHASYGTYQALFNLGVIFQIILDFGLINYNSRTISQQPDKIKEIFPSMLSARLILIVLYTALTCAFGFALGYRGWQIYMLAGVLMIQAFNTMLQFIRSNVSGLHHFKTDGILSISDRFLMILVCGFLLLYPATSANFKIEWFVLAQIACYGAATVVAFLVLRRIAHVKLRFTFHLPSIYAIIKQSFPYALLIFLMSVYTRADAPLIDRLCGGNGDEQAGIYAEGYRLLDIANQFGQMFATMLLPLFARMLVERQAVQPIIKLAVNIMLPIAFMIAVAAIFFGTPIMHLLYKNSGAYDAEVFAWYMSTFPAFCITFVYSTVLTANGSLKLLNKIAFVAVIINLGLNFYMIPHWQAKGAAITSVVTQYAVALFYIFFASKTIRLPKNIRWAAAHLGYIILIACAGYAVTTLPFSWMGQLFIFGASCLVFIFAFRFVSVAAIKQLVEKRNS
jgi:O-antigen/teichoic acid export membrane protein